LLILFEVGGCGEATCGPLGELSLDEAISLFDEGTLEPCDLFDLN